MDKPKVFIDGREGTTGLQLWERLSRRTDLELLRIGEARRKDPAERKKYLNAADLVFLCLPDAAAKEAGHDKAIRLDANALRNGDADRGHQGNSRVVGHKLSDKTGDEEQDHHNDERRGRGSDQPQNAVRNDTA